MSRTVLYVPPIGDEMNRARRMASLQARELSRAGVAVLLVDLFGCGDSAGELQDASFDIWVDDLARAAKWLRREHPDVPLTLWGLRAGCLLAAAASTRVGPVESCLFWQPTPDGATVLQNLLRLRLASGLQGRSGGESTKSLRQRLRHDGTLDIGGYVLSNRLAEDLEAARLDALSGVAHVDWLEVTTRQPAELLPASNGRIHDMARSGVAMTAEALPGPPFWQTTETEDAPALIRRSTHSLAGAGLP